MLQHGPSLSQEIPAQAMPLFKRIWGGHPQISFFAYYLEYLALHMPANRVVPALRFLIRSGYKEDKFLRLVHEDCARSAFELMRFVTMHLEHEKKMRKLYRKDFA